MSGVTIKTLQQKTFKIEIEHTETVRTLKEKIQEAKGEEEFPADMLKLIYAGKILDDTQPLTKYKIQPNGFVVVMVSKTRTPPKPAPAPAPEASTSTAATSGETSTETSTPATTETTQPSTEPPRTETDGETRMETSEATPTAQGSDTSASRGDQALQQAGSTLATGDELDEAISNLMALGYERDQVVRALNASFNNPDRAAEMLMSGNVPDVVPPPQGGAEEEPGEQPTRDTPSQQASGERRAGGNPFEFLRTTPQFQHLRQLVQQNPQALPAVLNQIGQANPQLIRLIAGNQQAFIDLLNEPSTSDAGSAGSSGSGGASAPPQAPSGGTPPAMQGAMPPGIQGMMPPGMQGMVPPGMQGAMPPGMQQQGPGVVSIQVTQEEKEAVERLKALGFSEAEVIQAYFACDKNEELTANFLLSDDNN